ncbi:MAG TPA: hypothetical protein VMC41_00720 [Candidatus Nanoarchaeia archaeon]|nr:hypothetical protein [Candidatus Nanoarchaeia archaeon]
MPEEKESSLKIPRWKNFLRQTIIFIAVVILLIFFVSSTDNFALVWNPKDWIAEAVYLINHRPAAVPKEFPAPSKEVAALVDPGLLPAFYLIEQDPNFSYLAKYAITNKIKITISDEGAMKYCGGDDACYDNIVSRCSKKTSPGVIYFKSKAVTEMRTYFLAGVLVHELTHAQNHLEKPAYYCQGEGHKYLSDEFLAFKNQDTFELRYDWFVIADYFDRQGNLHSYCLYSRIKEVYAHLDLIDDVNLRPQSAAEKFFCFFR